MIRIGVVGLGHWGPNLVRCFSELDDCQVTTVCDPQAERLGRIASRYPGIRAVPNFEAMLDLDLVDAVVIATPTATHFEIASKALENDLHVFVEKPLAQTMGECQSLISLAGESNRLLFVGHVFLHSAPVLKLRELVEAGELGDINYISSRRLNLGPVRKDVNALYDLAPHDISMMLYLLGELPFSVSCTGLAHLNKEIHDVCNLTMRFSANRLAMVHVSWLDPRKERVLTVVGNKRMAIYDDLAQEKIKVFDKGIETPPPTSNFADFQFSYRYGDSYCPWINESEPLKAECSEFVRCILEGDIPTTDGLNGQHVTQVLEAAQKSLLTGGQLVEVDSDLTQVEVA